MSLDAMKQALEALETCKVYDEADAWFDIDKVEEAAQALRLAIEQAERQEHSIEIRVYGQTVTFVTREPMAHYKDGDRFYRTQPQRQPLTVEEIEQATGCDRNKPLWIAIENAARAVERAHAIGGKQ